MVSMYRTVWEGNELEQRQRQSEDVFGDLYIVRAGGIDHGDSSCRRSVDVDMFDSRGGRDDDLQTGGCFDETTVVREESKYSMDVWEHLEQALVDREELRRTSG
jgi:hypothetical protein